MKQPLHNAYDARSGIHSCAYDTFGRFASVTSSVFAYSYLPATDLLSGLSTSTGHSWARTYEPHRPLITSVKNRFNETVISRYDYTNDQLGRRSGTAFGTMPVQDSYGYNQCSEVTSARRSLANNPAQEIRGFSYDYAYDSIGNRTNSTTYDPDNNALTSTYIATTQTYAEDATGIWWHITTQTHSCGGVTNATTTTRTQATELSPWCLACTVSATPNGETSTVSRAFVPEMDAIVETTQRSAATPTLRRTLYGYQIETAGLGTATLFSYDGFARVKSQTVTNASGIVSTAANVYDTLGSMVTNSTTYSNQTVVTATGYDDQNTNFKFYCLGARQTRLFLQQ